MSLRRRSLVAAVAAVALAVAGGLALAERRALLERWLASRLGPVAALEVREFGTHGIVIANVRAALPARGLESLAIEEVRLAWTPLGLWRGELGALAVRGLSARVAWPAPAAPSGEPAGSADALRWLALPSALELDAVELRIAVADSEIAVQAQASLASSAGVVSGGAKLVATGAAERAELELQIDRVAQGSATGRLRVSARLDPATRLPLRGQLEGELALAADTESVQLDVVGCPRLQLAQVMWQGTEWLRSAVDTCIPAGDTPLLRVVRAESGVAIDADLRLNPFELALRGGRAGNAADARIDRSALRVQRAADGSLRLGIRAEGARLRLPDAGAELRAWSVSGELDPKGDLRAELVKGELHDLVTPARFAPLEAHAELRRAPEAAWLDFAVDARSRAGLALRAVGHHDPTQQSGELALAPKTSTHAASALLAQLPIAKRWLQGARGELGVAGRATWSRAGVQLQTDLRAQGLDLATPWGVYTGVDGVVSLRGPDPWRTSSAAELRIRRIKYGLDWTDARVRFELEPGGALAIPEASAVVAGGSMHAAGSYRPGADESAFRVRLDGVDVRALLAHMELPGLVATGSLQGTLPLALRGGELEIRDGELVARDGVLQYRPVAAADAVNGQNPDLRRTLDALRDVRYDVLRIRMNGPLRGTPEIEVYVEGVNPTLEQGTPVQLTLNLDADLADLLRFPALGVPRR